MDFLDRVRNLMKGSRPESELVASALQATAPQPRSAQASLLKPSRAWQKMNSYWAEGEAISVLDLGCTSGANVNFFLNAGGRFRHEDLLRELEKEGGQPVNAVQYLSENLLLPAASLDAVLLWDVLDYVPQEMIQPLADRLSTALRPGGTLLALFHAREGGPEPVFHQYHIKDRDVLEWRSCGPRPLQQFFQVRHVEKLFSAFQSVHFFLGHDGMREVLMVR